MTFTEKYNDRLDEKYLYGVHETGLEIFIVPKDHIRSTAILGTRYGAMHRIFKTEKDDDFITVPDGIAHFLEHKLFENEDGSDTFSRFGEFGGNANAFTSDEMTAYYFTATDNYYENLEILLDFVTSPYFTEETVKKELGIIGQELKMYLDNPYRRLYKNLLEALYVDSHIKIDVGGTEESIAKITPEILYRCYGTFYNLTNMTLCLAGAFDEDKVIEVCDKILKHSEPVTISHSFPEEPEYINKELISEKFPIALPMFYAGIKDNATADKEKDPKASLKRIWEHKIISELLFGKSSDFYNELYDKGLINDKFSAGYSSGCNYSFIYFCAETRTPDKVIELIKEQIKKTSDNTDALKEDFEICKRMIYADCLQEWNSTADIAELLLEYRFMGADAMDIPDVVSAITFEDIVKRIKESYCPDKMAVSLVEPK